MVREIYQGPDLSGGMPKLEQSTQTTADIATYDEATVLIKFFMLLGIVPKPEATPKLEPVPTNAKDRKKLFQFKKKSGNGGNGWGSSW